MIAFTPDSVLFSVGPITVYWYGVMYAVGLVAVWLVLSWEARRRGLDTGLLANGMIIVAIAALAGGRLYHVIDQWQLYKDDPLRIILPPYAGLGAFGGLITGTIAGVLYARYKKQDVLVWTDVAMPGVLVMQAFARWGNFFNQELYGPPTNLPWGIAIDCTHRIPAYPCETYPAATTFFQPLFLYESLSGAIGAIVLLWVARRFPSRLLKGDIALLVVAWYSTTRFLLEPLRADNWTFNGIPTASIVSGILAVLAIAVLLIRHALHRGRPGADKSAAAAAMADASPEEAVTDTAAPATADAPSTSTVTTFTAAASDAVARDAAVAPEPADPPDDVPGTSAEPHAKAPAPAAPVRDVDLGDGI